MTKKMKDFRGRILKKGREEIFGAKMWS